MLLPSGYAELARPRQLRHHRQGEVVAIATLVVSLKGDVVDGEGCAIGKVGERARNRRRRGVINRGEDCAQRECACVHVVKEYERSTANGYAPGNNLIRCDITALEPEVKGPVRVERQLFLDGEGARDSSDCPRGQKCSGSASGPNGHATGYFARAPELAGINLHGAAACARASSVRNKQCTGATSINGGAPS